MRTIEVAGISVLWTLFAVGLMLIGVWMRRKAYRLSAIVLLIVTVLKVLAYDTAEVSTPYRILSCLVLGAMLVAVSFYTTGLVNDWSGSRCVGWLVRGER